jgi:hypothetical protein
MCCRDKVLLQDTASGCLGDDVPVFYGYEYGIKDALLVRIMIRGY